MTQMICSHSKKCYGYRIECPHLVPHTKHEEGCDHGTCSLIREPRSVAEDPSCCCLEIGEHEE